MGGFILHIANSRSLRRVKLGTACMVVDCSSRVTQIMKTLSEIFSTLCWDIQ
jgi:hypothetical protein